MFDGAEENFDKWEIQFNACAELEGFADAIGTALDLDMPANSKHVLDPALDTDKPKIAATQSESHGMLCLGVQNDETIEACHQGADHGMAWR